MIAIYVLAALLTTAMIAVVRFMTHSRRQMQGGDQADFGGAGPATVLAMDAGHADVVSRRDEFDPAGTMIHNRSLQARLRVVPKRRSDDAPRGRPSVRLVGLAGSLKGSSFVVAADGVTVGRSAYSDIVLRDSRVSFRHAWIGIVDDKVVLRDLKSTNGTFLNAQTRERITETALHAGDTIAFGSHQGDQFRIVQD